MKKSQQATFVSPSRFAVEKKEEKKIVAIAKLFALHANAVMILMWDILSFATTTTIRCPFDSTGIKQSFRNIYGY